MQNNFTAKWQSISILCAYLKYQLMYIYLLLDLLLLYVFIWHKLCSTKIYVLRLFTTRLGNLFIIWSCGQRRVHYDSTRVTRTNKHVQENWGWWLTTQFKYKVIQKIVTNSMRNNGQVLKGTTSFLECMYSLLFTIIKLILCVVCLWLIIMRHFSLR